MSYTPVSDRGVNIRLHLNENGAGCSPAVMTALRDLERESMSTYPDYGHATAECEAWLDVPPGWVQLTNGLDEGIQVVAQSARLSGDASRLSAKPANSGATFEAIVVEPAFEMYAACTEAAGGRVVAIPPARDFDFPLEAILSAVSLHTRLIYLADPNNPTGRAIPAGCVESIAAFAPQAIVFVDEAYADFSGRTIVGPRLDRHRNLVVGRTFAKAYGLAALRIGAIVGHPDSLEPLRRILLPYSVNVCAIQALDAALKDRACVDWYVEESVCSRNMIYEFCEERGLPFWPSDANFVLVRLGSAASRIVERLEARGVRIRDRSSQSGCLGCVRITAGLRSQTTACLAALEDVLASGDC